MWLMRQSKDRNLPFYLNTETCRSQWSCQPHFIPPIELPIAKRKLHADDCYYQITTNRNRCFYCNRETVKNTWKLPPLIKEKEPSQCISSLTKGQDEQEGSTCQKHSQRFSFKESKCSVSTNG